MERKIVKFNIEDLLTIGMVFVVTGIGLTYGLQVQGDVKNDIGVDSGTNSAEYNASLDAIDAVGTLASKMPTIATVVAAGLILGVLFTFLARRYM